MKKSITICFLVTLVFSLTATAQMMAPMKKGEELKKLEFLVGEWSTSDEMVFAPGAEPVKTAGTTTFTWQVGDVWIKQYTELPMGPMGTMYGTAHMTWDADKKMYVSFWIDNFASMIYKSTGNFDADGNLVMTGTSEYEGNTFHSRYTWTKKGDNTMVFVMEQSQGGENWMVGMTSNMTKK